MAELIGDLEDKRARHNADAESHKRLRDELNDKTKEWAEKRDQLNAQVRKLIEDANGRRENRDKLNSEVREAKAKRDEWNKKFNELSEAAMALRREKMPKSGLSIRKFKAELRALEKKHMTSVLSADKEKALMKEMSMLDAKIKEMEREIEQFTEVRTAEKDAHEAKDNAEDFHRKVSELAEKAQTEHDAMLKLYEEADALRKEADAAQEKFIETKLAADEEHHEHIEHIRQVHDFDKIIAGIRDKTRKSRKDKDDTSAKKEADEIYEKFRSGEKLSTEDIMVLQKSGYM
jgi:uncharacterized coiled-coil DUF342 family protein